MVLRATCHSCRQQFDLSELYGADPEQADRCPDCGAPLGPAGLGHLTFRIDRHLKALCQALTDLAAHPGAFTLDTDPLRDRALAAVQQLDEPPALHASSRVAATPAT